MQPASLASSYIVQEGDTLWSIASKTYRNSQRWPEIAAANGIRPPYTIFIGMRLVVPRSPSERLQTERLSRTARPAGTGGRLRHNNRRHPDHHNVDPTLGREFCNCGAAPALKFAFKSEGYFPMPDGEIKVTANGELTVQREGALSTIELSPGKIKLSTNSTVEMAAEGQPFDSTDEVSVKFRKEYKSKIADLFGDAKLSWNSVSGQAEITCSLAVVAKINGQKFITTKISMPRPNVFLFSFEPREVKGDGFEGKVGFDVRTYILRPRQAVGDSSDPDPPHG